MFRTFRVPSTFVLIVRDDSNDFPRRPHGLSTSGAVKAELATEAAVQQPEAKGDRQRVLQKGQLVHPDPGRITNPAASLIRDGLLVKC